MSPVNWTEVYARLTASADALEQAADPSPAEKARVLKERARRMAAREPESSASRLTELVVFRLGGEAYGVEARFVSRVCALKELTFIPCTPGFILGVTSVQGRVVTVLDLCKLFMLPEKGLAESDKLIMLGSGDRETVFRVDAVEGARSVDCEGAQPGLPALSPSLLKYVTAITRDRLTILDAEKLMADPDLVINEEVEQGGG